MPTAALISDPLIHNVFIELEMSGASLLGVCWGGQNSCSGLSKHIKIILGGGGLTAGQGAKGAAYTVCPHVWRDIKTHGITKWFW